MSSLEITLPPLAKGLTRRPPRAARLALALLGDMTGGSLAVSLPNGDRIRVGEGPDAGALRVAEWSLFDRVLAAGDIGLGESWMAGGWECDDLAAVLTLLARNRPVLRRAVYGRALSLLGYRLRHLLRANSREGSARNIMAHYDLGNDFYRLWLDDSMTYSAGLFDGPTDTLEAAQRRKYQRLLAQVGAAPGDTILELGCGWGGFAEVAAREVGCKVLGITLSPAQLRYARERAAAEAWADRATFALCDYRDVAGQYDHIVSVEMIEAVGEAYWPTYFRQIAARLRPGGRCAIQAITIDDVLFPRYRRGTDFIQRYVFPGGMLPSRGAIAREASRAGLQIEDDFGFGADYARTLAEWHQRFLARQDAVRALGFPERFLRLWRFYLAYCEAGFRAGDIDVRHVVLAHGTRG
ncbi:MAG: class I SAM-dependent methyltransferase [Zoogloeaceae bacterium]|nr:class I SAM-dependent methyltransferase [Zoogloeaceae bacterium]